MKEYVKPIWGFHHTNNHQPEEEQTTDAEAQITVYVERDITVDLGKVPTKVPTKMGLPEEKAFRDSRKAELDKLFPDGTFEPIHESEIKGNTKIFCSRFVDELKKAGEEVRLKSRLVAQNYADEDAAYIPTKAPTIQRFSQRISLSLSASFPNMATYTRDITQSYIQSTSKPEQDV